MPRALGQVPASIAPRRLLRGAVWAAAWGLLSCAAPDGAPEPAWVGDAPAAAAAELTVLMMGNSHTDFHALPRTLDTLLRAGPAGTTVAVAVAPGWMFLDQRLAHAPSMALLQGRRWTVVVLQAQRVSASGRVLYSTREAEELVRQARLRGALPVLFAEWPRRGVAETDAIDARYQHIARAQAACVAPVGRAWDLALQRHPELVLHAADGNHANEAGAYLAALVLYLRIAGAPPRAWPVHAGGPDLLWQRRLQQVALDTLSADPPQQACRAALPPPG